jgi:hypothetical protein
VRTSHTWQSNCAAIATEQQSVSRDIVQVAPYFRVLLSSSTYKCLTKIEITDPGGKVGGGCLVEDEEVARTIFALRFSGDISVVVLRNL